MMKAPSTLLAGAAALALSLPLWAQNAPPSGGAHTGPHSGPTSASHTGAHPGGHGDHAHRAQTMERMKAGQERRLQELKLKLQLSADQEPAWTAFASAMALPMQAHHSRPDWAQLALLPTPERIERMKALREQHHAQAQARMDQRAQATRSFYDLLQAPQKKVFDEETGKHLAQRGRHHRHG
jgi:hypothetical protein